jgi:hypothetical protein
LTGRLFRALGRASRSLAATGEALVCRREPIAAGLERSAEMEAGGDKVQIANDRGIGDAVADLSAWLGALAKPRKTAGGPL